jgi:hypothetical protein
MLEIPLPEMLGSNLGRDATLPDRLLWFSSAHLQHEFHNIASTRVAIAFFRVLFLQADVRIVLPLQLIVIIIIIIISSLSLSLQFYVTRYILIS